MKRPPAREAFFDSEVFAMAKIEAGIYRHFKGNVYRVLCCALNSETLEEMVVYRSEDAEGKCWVRPASMWNDTVVRDGKECMRFTRIGDA